MLETKFPRSDSVINGKWRNCTATPTGDIDKDGCARISKVPSSAARFCEAHGCVCPWRHKQQAASKPAGVVHTVLGTMSTIPTTSSYKEFLAAARTALENKEFLKVDPKKCRLFPDGNGQPRAKGSISEEDIEHMESSLRDIGQINPCLARKAKDGMLEVFSGEKRWRAAGRIAGRKLEVLAVEFADERIVPFILACAANGNQTPLRPLEMCDAICRLVYREEVPIREVAEDIFGITIEKARAYQRLERLTNEAREKLARGEITETDALKLAQYAGDEQRKAVSDLSIGKAINRQPDPLPRHAGLRGRRPDSVARHAHPIDKLRAQVTRFDAAARGLEQLLKDIDVKAVFAGRHATRAEIDKSLSDTIERLQRVRKTLARS